MNSFGLNSKPFRPRPVLQGGGFILSALFLSLSSLGQNAFVVTNLVSDIPGLAVHTDTNLVNAWGIATSASSPFWVADNHSGYSTVYATDGTPQPLVVAVPGVPGGEPLGAPTGIIFNSTTNFQVGPAGATAAAKFIFVTEDGTVSGWASGTSALIAADHSASGAIYKGLASAKWGGQDYLYAANFHGGTVEVFDGSFHAVTWTNAFVDPDIPAGYAPFNIQNLGGLLYVTYAKQDENGEDDVGGPGHGYIDIYTTGGGWVKRFASEGVLDSPWGLVIAPPTFGDLAGTLLVGNFGDGKINAFDVVSGALRGTLSDAGGTPLHIQGLWGLIAGNGGKGGDPGTIYFAAGIAGDGAVEDHGLFGSISPVQPSTVAANLYLETDLVSDLPGLAAHTDTNLVNPWGIAISGSSPFWIADNHSGYSTVYTTDGTPQPLIVGVQGPDGTNSLGAPTGVIFNSTTNFQLTTGAVARFIFATEDGTLAAWAAGASATVVANRSTNDSIYKGLALGHWNGTDYLYAADFHNGAVDVFDAQFHLVSVPGGFMDAGIPAGFAPFNVQNFGGLLYVTYAKQDEEGEDDVSGPGNGYINIFTTGGQFVKRFASNGVLNSPWGLTVAPQGFGAWSGALLVGNFGDGRINAFNPVSGASLGVLDDPFSQPIKVPGLWALQFGNGSKGGDTNKLYFTAGIPGDGGLEDHGLFGSLALAGPAIKLLPPQLDGAQLNLSWQGGFPPYQVQSKAELLDGSWSYFTSTTNSAVSVTPDGEHAFFRVVTE